METYDAVEPVFEQTYDQPQGPVVINIEHQGGGESFCPTCNRNTTNEVRKVAGNANILWMILCCFMIGFLGIIALFWEGCMDTEIVCPHCQTVKTLVQAECM